MATALWLFLFAYADIYFSANDDQFLLRVFTSSLSNGAPTFHPYVHTLITLPLRWLNQLFPGVVWVSVLEIALLWLSTATISKSLIQCFEKGGNTNGYIKGVFFAFCFMLLFLFFVCARPTYTIVAAALGAAGVAQLMSVDFDCASNSQLIRSIVYCLVLLILCYGLRQVAALPALAFCGVVWLYRFFTCFGIGSQKKRSAKPVILILISVIVITIGLAAAREAEISLRGQRDAVAWQKARTSVLDYLSLEKISADVYDTVGWSETQVTLLQNWYTMEEVLSTENFEYVYQTSSDIRPSAGAAIWDFRTLSPYIAFSLVILFAVGLCCLTGLLIRRGRLCTLLALVAAGCGCMVLLAYLAIQGRLPYRAVLSPVLPAAALVFCLIPECLPTGKRWFTLLVCAVLAAGTTAHIVPVAQRVRFQESPWDYNTHAAMDQIALSNPDTLFIYSNELVNDLRMFPDFSSGIPDNLIFWGGWQRTTPDYIAKMEAFGLDSEHFTPADWLRPELRYLTLEEEPHPVLVQHLREKLGDNLRWEQTQMDIALYAYRFYLE